MFDKLIINKKNAFVNRNEISGLFDYFEAIAFFIKT